jgi:hypothetical protein
MQRLFRKPRPAPVLAMAFAAVVLLAACSRGASAPTATTIVPTVAAANVAAATTAPIAMPTVAPLAPTSPATAAPAATRPPAMPTASGSATAKATNVPVATNSTVPKPPATAGAGGSALFACDVITKADVEAVLGTPVQTAPTDAASAAGDGTSLCIYSPQGKGGGGVMVTLGQPNDPAAKLPVTQAMKGSTLQPLSGIGDEAATDGKHIVITRKNGRSLVVIAQSDGSNGASGLDVSKQLAKIGAARL